MKRSTKQSILLLLIVCVLLLLGYYRDFVFKTINAVLQAKEYDALFTSPPTLQFLDHYSAGGLMKLKWALTLLFTLVYLGITLFTIKIVFDKRKYNRLTIGVYIVIMLLSGILMLMGYAFDGLAERMYEPARYLMGLAQSPVILMILIPAFKLSGQEHNNIAN
jgi:hypothetical protein